MSQGMQPNPVFKGGASPFFLTPNCRSQYPINLRCRCAFDKTHILPVTVGDMIRCWWWSFFLGVVLIGYPRQTAFKIASRVMEVEFWLKTFIPKVSFLVVFWSHFFQQLTLSRHGPRAVARLKDLFYCGRNSQLPWQCTLGAWKLPRKRVFARSYPIVTWKNWSHVCLLISLFDYLDSFLKWTILMQRGTNSEKKILNLLCMYMYVL